MRVLVVGCGYVGRPLAAQLAAQGHTVFGGGRRATADAALTAAGVQPLALDVTRPETLARLPGPFDAVVNTVASTAGGGPDDYVRTYLEGTRHLLAALATAPPGRYVYTSSTSVYGQDDGSWVDEAAPAEPVADTARVLRQTEETLLDAFRREGFPAVILRVSGIYGPGRGHWFRQFLRGEARVPGDGSRYMNMIHQDDLVAALEAALLRGKPGEIYNATDDEPVRYLDFFQWLAQRLGKPLPPGVPEQALERRKRGLTHKRISNRKLREALGVALRHPTFREGYGEELRRLGLPAGERSQ